MYAFDAATGKPRWMRHLGEPVQASTLPCGDIRPVTGVTGTPAVDAGRGSAWVVAFVSSGGPPRHLLFELSLADGAVRSQRPADPPGGSPATHQQRGALRLANGYVYVPYGGLLGDCGQYWGSLVGMPAAGGGAGGTGAAAISYRVPCDRECGLWAPGGPAVDVSGNLFVATGNGEPFDRFTYANSVLKLSPQLQLLDYFAPPEWSSLSRSDSDLGSISPVLLSGGLVWISGKSGQGYLLRSDHLGGIGGQAFAGAACPSFSAALWVSPVVYAACPGELDAFRVDTAGPSFALAWKRPLGSPGGPILACGRLWLVDTASGRLLALDPASGTPVFTLDGGSSMHFVRPAAASSSSGPVFAALGGRLVAAACP